MKATKQRVFHYHADASALGGVLDHPYRQVVTSPASVSLAPAGGNSSSRADAFRLEHVLSTSASYAHVAGAEEPTGDAPWTTLVTAVVEGLNLFEIVTADRVVAQLAVRHPKTGSVPTASLSGSQFVNLRVNGQPVTPALRHDVLNVKQPAGKPAISFWRHPDLRARAVAQSKVVAASSAPDWMKDRYGWWASDQGPEDRGFLQCSAVDDVQVTGTSQSIGHVVHVPDLGDLIFGELILDSGTARLTMLRVELGCLATGTLTVCTGSFNGVGMP